MKKLTATLALGLLCLCGCTQSEPELEVNDMSFDNQFLPCHVESLEQYIGKNIAVQSVLNEFTRTGFTIARGKVNVLTDDQRWIDSLELHEPVTVYGIVTEDGILAQSVYG